MKISKIAPNIPGSRRDYSTRSKSSAPADDDLDSAPLLSYLEATATGP
jgi:hypothetical protein